MDKNIYSNKIVQLIAKGAVKRGNFFLQLATQVWVKKIFQAPVELYIYASCCMTCSRIILQTGLVFTGGDFSCKRQLETPLRCKLQEKIASCDMALKLQRIFIEESNWKSNLENQRSSCGRISRRSKRKVFVMLKDKIPRPAKNSMINVIA